MPQQCMLQQASALAQCYGRVAVKLVCFNSFVSADMLL